LVLWREWSPDVKPRRSQEFDLQPNQPLGSSLCDHAAFCVARYAEGSSSLEKCANGKQSGQLTFAVNITL
jgi:hypothetical protein